MGEVVIKNKKLIIDGKPRSLLCSSLFYFRIPKELWEDRMLKIKKMGYNTLDVYFPWNYHEREEGKWQFDGNRDVVAFLELAKKNDMYVISRPGPYICSEWDMGGLPSYLLTKNVLLRQNDPAYLKYVGKWYSKILPILVKYQISNKGTIVALQIENELDFYNCKDVRGYINELNRMVNQFDFRIPIIACAGQGDICGAIGNVKNVFLALNVYQGFYNRNFACNIKHIRKLCDEMDTPLLVTETDRNIAMIRMLFGIGASLIAPYNQVGGSNYFYYNGLSNWENPNVFMTSDYDFASLVTPDGEYSDSEREAIIFRGIYRLFEYVVAQGQIYIHEEGSSNDVHYVAEKDDTKLHTFLNPEKSEITVSINDKQLRLLPYSVCYVVEKFSLALYIDAEVVFSTAEIMNIKKLDKKIMIDVFTRTNSFITLKFNNKSNVMVNGNKEPSGEVNLEFINTSKLVSIICDEVEVLIKNYGFEDIETSKGKPFHSIKEFQIAEVTNIKQVVAKKQNISCKDIYLEDYGIFYGVGEYKFNLQDNKMNLTKMLILENPGDLLNIYQDDEHLETIANGGVNQIICIREERKKKFKIRAEIWGHSNFHDNITPNTMLNSKRGVKRIVAVTNYEDISESWFIKDLNGIKKYNLMQKLGKQLYIADSFKATYIKTISLKKANVMYLYFKESEASYFVNVNEIFVGKVYKKGFLDISSFNSFNDINLEIFVEKSHYSSAVSQVFLMQGYQIENCDIRKIENAEIESTELKKATLPNIALAKGKEYLVSISIKGQQLKNGIVLNIIGKNILVKSIANKKVYSRIFLSDNEKQSKVSGGNPNKMFLPNEILQGDSINLYVYAINHNSNLAAIYYKIL